MLRFLSPSQPADAAAGIDIRLTAPTTTRYARVIVATAVLLTAAAAALASPGAAAAPLQRATSDQRDALSGPQIHAIYFVPADTKDRRLDITGQLRSGLGNVQAWFARNSGGLTWRLDVLPRSGAVDITFVRGMHDDDHYDQEESLRTIEDELVRRGFGAPDKKYLVFYAGDTTDGPEPYLCGEATVSVHGPTQYHPVSPGRYPTATSFASVRLYSLCNSQQWGTAQSPGWPEATIMHELVHTQDLVSPGAPNACGAPALDGSHICTFKQPAYSAGGAAELDPERRDLMFPFITARLADLTLDRGNNDYFQSPFGLLDLANAPFVDGSGSPGGSAARRTPIGAGAPHDHYKHGCKLSLLPSLRILG
jgi:hypothetical protein